MSIQQLPPKRINIESLSVKAIPKLRNQIIEKLQADCDGKLFKRMNKGGMEEKIVILTSSRLPLELTANITVRTGEIFFDLEDKVNRRVFASNIPLIPTLVFRTPTYRENEELVYLRKYPESVQLMVMDDVDHELIYSCNQSNASIIGRKDEPGSMFLVNTGAITHFQPLTHWPTRILLNSIATELEKLTEHDHSREDATDIPTYRYLIDKALTTGNIDTVPINPLNILNQVNTILQSNRDNTKAQSLAVIIERFSEELEELQVKYQNVWPKIIDGQSFTPDN